MSGQHIRTTASLRSGLVADPEAKHFRRMRQAIWVYLYLLLAVNRTSGKRLLSPTLTAGEMGIREETIRSWLGHLKKAGYISLQRAGDLVVVRITRWQPDVRDALGDSKSPAVQSQMARPPVTPKELAQTLGGRSEDPLWRKVLVEHDPVSIRQILDEVSRVPESRIRKSRIALFRYLLKKHSPT